MNVKLIASSALLKSDRRQRRVSCLLVDVDLTAKFTIERYNLRLVVFLVILPFEHLVMVMRI